MGSVLLVASLINRPYVLDLLPDRSVVRRLGEAGLDVWMLDWGTPLAEDADRGLADYALEVLPAAAAQVAAATDGRAPHIVGYCMGGTFALIALGAQRLRARSLVAMATPVALHDEGLLSLWCRSPGFDARELHRCYGNIPPHLLQPAFKMLDPVGLATKLGHLDEHMNDDNFLRFFLAMETWLEDSVAFPGRAFTEWVDLYKSDSLSSGALRLGGARVDLRNVTCPVRSLVAAGDYITPSASSTVLGDLIGGTHELVTMRGGHIGLATGGEAQRTLWPATARWMAEQPEIDLMQVHKKAPAARPAKATRTPSAGSPRPREVVMQAHKKSAAHAPSTRAKSSSSPSHKRPATKRSAVTQLHKKVVVRAHKKPRGKRP